MDKYLFLDIDGVLALGDTLEIEKQALLGMLLKSTNCKIVLSSSHRKHTLEDTKEYLTKFGFHYVDEVIGITIRAYHYLVREPKIHLSIPRGVEIKQWIDTHIHSDNGKNFKRKILGTDYNYCILDDDTDMLLEHQNNFVHCDSEVGLTIEDVFKAIKILNNSQ